MFLVCQSCFSPICLVCVLFLSRFEVGSGPLGFWPGQIELSAELRRGRGWSTLRAGSSEEEIDLHSLKT